MNTDEIVSDQLQWNSYFNNVPVNVIVNTDVPIHSNLCENTESPKNLSKSTNEFKKRKYVYVFQFLSSNQTIFENCQWSKTAIGTV